MARKVTRRGFFTRLGAAAIALTLARHLPGIAPAPLVLAPPRAGDVFTVAGWYAKNPATGKEMEFLQKFVVISDVTDDTIQARQIWPHHDGDVAVEDALYG